MLRNERLYFPEFGQRLGVFFAFSGPPVRQSMVNSALSWVRFVSYSVAETFFGRRAYYRAMTM